jgi:hypothetical protein
VPEDFAAWRLLRYRQLHPERARGQAQGRVWRRPAVVRGETGGRWPSTPTDIRISGSWLLLLGVAVFLWGLVLGVFPDAPPPPHTPPRQTDAAPAVPPGPMLPPHGTSGQCLRSNGVGTPSYGPCPGDTDAPARRVGCVDLPGGALECTLSLPLTLASTDMEVIHGDGWVKIYNRMADADLRCGSSLTIAPGAFHQIARDQWPLRCTPVH